VVEKIAAGDVTDSVVALFDPAGPAHRRCLAVLRGLTAGTILVDDARRPRWSIVREACDDGTTFLGGALDAATLARVIAALRAAGDVLIGLWPDDPRWSLMPPDPGYDGRVLEWVGRAPGADLPPLRRLPDGCAVRPITPALLERCAGRVGIVRHFGGEERFFRDGLGYCLLVGETVACEVFGCPLVDGVRELWVETHPAYRRRGYAAATCAHAIAAGEGRGERIYWNTAVQNRASIALAHALGYGPGREYRLLGWSRCPR
jgi:GNAT superfamily N-acetyltransferase